jgi:hypothetical protein
VIRFFENGNKEILFANGNFSTFNGEVWTNTNNKVIITIILGIPKIQKWNIRVANRTGS